MLAVFYIIWAMIPGLEASYIKVPQSPFGYEKETSLYIKTADGYIKASKNIVCLKCIV